MRNWIILNLLLLMFTSSSDGQDIPVCIRSLNRKTTLGTTSFQKVVHLTANRTVYQFAVKSVPQCMDCQNGTVFYDENCDEIASFLTGRVVGGHIDYGYTASELGKGGFPNIRYRAKKDDVSGCIAKIIANTDSLNKAGVRKIVQVRIKGKILYGFEKWIDPKLANCKDCSKSIVYYNADCKPEVTFQVGGLAGVKGDNGYTASDFTSKTVLKIIWNSYTINTNQPTEINNKFKDSKVPTTYTVGKNLFSDFGVFKLGDKLTISTREGLKHFRNGKMLNVYKIIPQQLTENQAGKSNPSVSISKQYLIYYLDPFNRYFRIADNSFMVTKATYHNKHNFKDFTEADWTVAFNIE